MGNLSIERLSELSEEIKRISKNLESVKSDDENMKTVIYSISNKVKEAVEQLSKETPNPQPQDSRQSFHYCCDEYRHKDLENMSMQLDNILKELNKNHIWIIKLYSLMTFIIVSAFVAFDLWLKSPISSSLQLFVAYLWTILGVAIIVWYLISLKSKADIKADLQKNVKDLKSSIEKYLKQNQSR